MKVSIVIPVYNERAFIEEVLLRVQAVPIDKEIIVVDDKSSDGTRLLLEDLDKAQTQGKRDVLVQNGKARLPLENMRFIFQPRTAERALPCAGALKRQSAMLCWCKTLTSSTTPRTMRCFWNPFLTTGPMWFTVRDSWAARNAFIIFGTIAATNF
jgi:glycosyltransferase involved in cell wall biosynthesis